MICSFLYNGVFVKINKLNSLSVNNMNNVIKKRRKLYSWQQGLLNGDFQIIHTMSSEIGVTSKRNLGGISPFERARFEDVVSTWDIMSGSLLSYSKGEGRGALPTHLVLDVPYQNILGTHDSDVWFPNHAGRLDNLSTGILVNPYDLVDRINRGKAEDDKLLGVPFNTLEDFKFFTSKMSDSFHNEILIICKPELLIIDGVPKTARVKLKDIVYNVEGDFLNKIKIKNDIKTVQKIALINNLKSVSFIFDHERISSFYQGSISFYDEIRHFLGDPIYTSFNRSVSTKNHFARKLKTAPNLSYAYHPLDGYRDLAVFPIN
ncbi:Uncharacterised protein [Yersinia intermedia]|uniref:Uncharacterized protein n=2 Tax=Yersinia intermedia TaxID=631 RepID=A0A0H5LXQ7_YERIN|nr:Uncharacterised protein [Yersinia intermedia]